MLANQNINTYIAGEVLIETKPPLRLQTTCKNEEILVTVQERNYSKFSGRKLKKNNISRERFICNLIIFIKPTLELKASIVRRREISKFIHICGASHYL